MPTLPLDRKGGLHSRQMHGCMAYSLSPSKTWEGSAYRTFTSPTLPYKRGGFSSNTQMNNELVRAANLHEQRSASILCGLSIHHHRERQQHQLLDELLVASSVHPRPSSNSTAADMSELQQWARRYSTATGLHRSRVASRSLRFKSTSTSRTCCSSSS